MNIRKCIPLTISLCKDYFKIKAKVILIPKSILVIGLLLVTLPLIAKKDSVFKNISPQSNPVLMLDHINLLIDVGETDQGLEQLYKVQKQLETFPDEIQEARTNLIFSKIYYLQERYWEAKSALKLALDAFKKNELDELLLEAHLLNGKIELKNGELKRAKTSLDQVISKTNLAHLPHLHLEALEQLATLEASRKAFTLSIDYLKHGLRFKDSINLLEKEVSSGELLAGYKQQALFQENKLLLAKGTQYQSAINRFKLKYYGMFLLFLLASIFAFIFYKDKQRNKELLENLIKVNENLTAQNNRVVLQKDALSKQNKEIQSNQSTILQVNEDLRKELSTLKHLRDKFEIGHNAPIVFPFQKEQPIQKLGKVIKDPTPIKSNKAIEEIKATNIYHSSVDLNRSFEKIFQKMESTLKKKSIEIKIDTLPNVAIDRTLIIPLFEKIIQQAISLQTGSSIIAITSKIDGKNHQIEVNYKNKHELKDSPISIFRLYAKISANRNGIWTSSDKEKGTTISFLLPKTDKKIILNEKIALN